MKNNHNTFFSGSDNEFLKIIAGISFTPREIDIISCCLSGKATKGIASFLGMSPRTVETHTRAIMLKLESNSREGIIKFIEKSDKFCQVKTHYNFLLIQSDFKCRLQEISILIRHHKSLSFVISKVDHEQDPFLTEIIYYLTLAGIKITTENKEKLPFSQSFLNLFPVSYKIYKTPVTEFSILPTNGFNEIEEDSLLPQEYIHYPILFLLRMDTSFVKIPQVVEDIGYVNFQIHGNNYFAFFELLKKILPTTLIDPIFSTFKKQYETIFEANSKETPEINSSSKESIIQNEPYVFSIYTYLKTFISNPKNLSIGIGIFLGFIYFIFLISPYKITQISILNKNKNVSSVRSELLIPHESSLLNRTKILNQIEQEIQKQKPGIKCVALIGIGGAGKTTLARQYALSYKTSLKWEINAETKESLINSFEKLAYALTVTEEDYRILANFRNLKDELEREGKILYFVRERLKLRPGWALIYDNVEFGTNIQKYIPHTSELWGEGIVIMTTRDENINHNSYVSSVVLIEELQPNEKLDLFMKIINHEKNLIKLDVDKKQTQNFLAHLPPFPLDVLVSANYFKETKIGYDQYLDSLNKSHPEFEMLQTNLLKESSDYFQTRYSIITISIQKIIKAHKDFSDLFLLISLLGSQNIPRDLLDTYKGSEVVDNFIYNLKKYSLITTKKIQKNNTYTLYIHRSIQQIALAYLFQLLDLKNQHTEFFHIGKILKKNAREATDKSFFARINLLLPHYNAFLSHTTLLPKQIQNNLMLELGAMYHDLVNYSKAKNIIEKRLSYLKKNDSKNYEEMARCLSYLGDIYRMQDNLKKAQDALEESVSLHIKHSTNKASEAQALLYLGIVYREQGNYEKSKNVLEKSLSLCEKHRVPTAWKPRALNILSVTYRYIDQYKLALSSVEKSLDILKREDGNDIDYARGLSYIGKVYQELGEFGKARDCFEQSIKLLKKHHSDPFYIFNTLGELGEVYKDLGNYQQASLYFEQSFTLCKESFSENNRYMVVILEYLGNINRKLGHFEKSKNLLEQSLSMCEKYAPEHHLTKSWVLSSLGNIHRELGNLEKALKFLEESLNIYQKYLPQTHVFMGWIFSHLGAVYRDLGKYDQARDYFTKGLFIYEKHFGQMHTKTARVLRNIGLLDLKEGNNENSKKALQQALYIFEKSKHPECYIVLENLAEVYIDEYTKCIKNKKSSNIYKEQAYYLLTKSLKLAKEQLSQHSAHVIRIQTKLQLVA